MFHGCWVEDAGDKGWSDPKQKSVRLRLRINPPMEQQRSMRIGYDMTDT